MRYLVPLFAVMFLLSPLVLGQIRTDAAFEDQPLSIDGRGPSPVQDPHLYHAEAGARWLMSIALEPSPGIYKWYNSDLDTTTFMTEQSMGVVGIGKFFLMLHDATGNATYLEYAEGAGKWLISLAEPTAPDACRWSKWEGLNEYDPDHYGGIGSTIEYLMLLHQATDDPIYLEYAIKGANWLVDEAIPVGAGYKWRSFSTINYNMTGWYHGTAGISYILYELYKETGDIEYRDHALGGAQWLIDMANEPAPGQRSWVRVEGEIAPSTTWCGGTCGIVQFFVLMYNATGNRSYLDQARAGGNWTLSQAVVMGPEQVTIDYMNMFCHGDPSQALVLFMLYDATNDERYRTCAEQLMNWVISQRLDVNLNESKWPHLVGGSEYITGLLMGNSGIGHSLIMSYGITGNQTYLDLAKRSAAWVENRSMEVSSGVERWNHMEKMDDTEEYCTGWYWGVAGIGQFLLEMSPYWVPPVGIEIIGDDRSAGAYPGEEAVNVLEIRNTGGGISDIKLDILEPTASWSYELTFDGKEVRPGEVRELTLSVQVPENAPANDDRTLVIKAAIAGSEVNDTVEVTTYALRVWGIGLVSDDDALHCDPGDNATFRLNMTNNGNAIDDIGLTAACETLPARYGPLVTFNGTGVPPGGTREALVKVIVPNGTLGNVSFSIIIKAFSVSNGSVSVLKNVTLVVGSTYGVRLGSDMGRIPIAPFSSVSTTVHVRNVGNVPDTYVFDNISLGAGWNVTVDMEDGEIAPNVSRSALVNISLGSNVPPSVHDLGLIVRSKDHPSVNASIMIVVEVLEHVSVELLPPQGGSAKPGDTVTYEFVLKSKSNIPLSYNVEAVSRLGWQIEVVSESDIEVLPGAIERIELAHTIPLGTIGGTVDTLSLRLNSSDGRPLLMAVVNTTSLPVRSFMLSLYHDKVINITSTGSYANRLNITNSGTESLVMDLNLSGPGAELVTLSRDRVEIAAGSVESIDILIEVPDGIKGIYPVIIDASDGNTSRTVQFVMNVTLERTSHRDRSPLLRIAIIIILLSVVLLGLMIFFLVKKNGRGTSDDDIVSPGPDQGEEGILYEDWGLSDEG
ncbi:MAG: hypothetical protein MUC62_06365 [Candidatus Thermoplasmatota archaeon]|nr:hypothetical protein [Candidatus Thermoplasmatota archaeon]